MTFVLQESSIPTYYPQDVISDYALPAYQGSADKNIDIDYVFMINVPLVLDNEAISYDFHYKNGVDISGMASFHRNVSYGNVITLSLRIACNNTEDVTGRYFHEAFLLNTALNICIHIGYELDFLTLLFFTLHWNIISYSE